jgi:hypothetical protein
MQHLPWVAGIESGLETMADRNRFIILDLDPPATSQRGKLALPSEPAINDLGVRLLAVALRNMDRARALFYYLRTVQVPGVNSRVIESYAVAAALKAAVDNCTHDQARAVLVSFLRDKHLVSGDVSDEQELMRAILEAFVDCGQGRRITPPEILGSKMQYLDHREALERHGMGLLTGHVGPRTWSIEPTARLFLNPDAVKRYLLRGTRWADLGIGQYLERLGGKYEQHALAGKRVWGWALPALDWIEPSAATGDSPDVSSDS